jgi:hypothetical protein
MPTQTAADILAIQNHVNLIPDGNSGTNFQVYTCAFGTMIYDSTNNSIRIAVNNGADAPIFKTVTLT